MHKKRHRLENELQLQKLQLEIARAMNSARYQHKLRHYDKANIEIDKAINELLQFQPKISAPELQSEVNQWISTAYNIKAKIARVRGDATGDVLSYYQKALEYNSEDGLVCSSIGALLNDAHNHESALKYHQRSFSLLPYQPNILFNYARGLHQLAVERYRSKAIQQNEFDDLMEKAGLMYERAFYLSKNEKDKYAVSKMYYGIWYIDKGEKYYPKAIGEFNEALKIQPQHPELLYVRGTLKAIINEDINEARKDLRAASRALQQKQLDLPDYKRLEEKIKDVENFLTNGKPLAKGFKSKKI